MARRRRKRTTANPEPIAPVPSSPSKPVEVLSLPALDVPCVTVDNLYLRLPDGRLYRCYMKPSLDGSVSFRIEEVSVEPAIREAE